MENVNLANKLRDKGIERSKNSAENRIVGWGNMAYSYLKNYINNINWSEAFMAEDVRFYAERNGLPTPPSKTSWGSVMRRAAKSKLIISCGYAQTKNPLAHRTPATVWVKA